MNELSFTFQRKEFYCFYAERKKLVVHKRDGVQKFINFIVNQSTKYVHDQPRIAPPVSSSNEVGSSSLALE